MSPLEWLAQAGDAWVGLLERMTDAGVAFHPDWLRELGKAEGRLVEVLRKNGGATEGQPTVTDETVYGWAIRGSAGWLRALESATDRGENFGLESLQELERLSVRLSTLVRRQRELNGI